jgi:hypothetical protein
LPWLGLYLWALFEAYQSGRVRGICEGARAVVAGVARPPR